MTKTMMITGEKAADVAAMEAKLEEFNERTEKEYRTLQENFRDVVCSAFGIPKSEYEKYELSLTSKFYKPFGLMFLEKHANPMQELFESMGDPGTEPATQDRTLN